MLRSRPYWSNKEYEINCDDEYGYESDDDSDDEYYYDDSEVKVKDKAISDEENLAACKSDCLFCKHLCDPRYVNLHTSQTINQSSFISQY